MTRVHTLRRNPLARTASALAEGEIVVSLDQSNWRDRTGHIVVLGATAAAVSSANRDLVDPTRLVVTPKRSILRATLSLVNPNGSDRFKPESLAPELVKHAAGYLAVRHHEGSNMEVGQVVPVLDLSGDGRPTALVGSLDDLKQVMEELGQNDHPLASHAAEVIRVATGLS